MNCREAQSQLFAERDGALDDTGRTALEGHLAHCSDCQRVREDLTAALTAWRMEVNHAKVPDAEREWHAVRRRIRGGDEAGATRNVRPRRNFFTWIAIPLGAAAAIAMALFVSPQSTGPAGAPKASAARANSVEVSGDNASTVIFVDDQSGWLFVMASDPNPKQG